MKVATTEVSGDNIIRKHRGLFAESAAINVDGGWMWLVAGLCQVLERVKLAPREALKIRVVEQRLGTLCVHYRGGDARVEQMVAAVQIASQQVCELCGSDDRVGSVYATGIKTICEPCRRRDPGLYGSHLIENNFSEAAVKRIAQGIDSMPGGPFSERIAAMLETAFKQ